MIERDRLYLGHILAAIDDIADFTRAGREAFIPDRKTQSAVIRQLEIIGEAVKRLTQDLPTSRAQVQRITAQSPGDALPPS